MVSKSWNIKLYIALRLVGKISEQNIKQNIAEGGSRIYRTYVLLDKLLGNSNKIPWPKRLTNVFYFISSLESS